MFYAYTVHVNMFVCVSYVSPPSPIEVKKLMAKRVFLGLSRGNRPSKNGCRVLKHTKITSQHDVGLITYHLTISVVSSFGSLKINCRHRVCKTWNKSIFKRPTIRRGSQSLIFHLCVLWSSVTCIFNLCCNIWLFVALPHLTSSFCFLWSVIFLKSCYSLMKTKVSDWTEYLFSKRLRFYVIAHYSSREAFIFECGEKTSVTYFSLLKDWKDTFEKINQRRQGFIKTIWVLCVTDVTTVQHVCMCSYWSLSLWLSLGRPM